MKKGIERRRRREQILQQEEIDALLEQDLNFEATNNCSYNKNDENIKLYDFAKDRIVRGKMPTLDMINEKFIKNVKITLFNLLKQEISIDTEEIEIIKHFEYLARLKSPASINIVNIKPLNGQTMFVLDLNLVYNLIDNLFGGNGKNVIPKVQNEFSDIENKIISNFLNMIFPDLNKAYGSVIDVNFEYETTENNPKMVNIINPNETLVVKKFVVYLGNVKGILHIAIPFSVLEPVKDLLYSEMQSDVKHNEEWKNAFHAQVLDTKLKTKGVLATKEMNLQDLSSLNLGDVIQMDLNKAVKICANGVPVFLGNFGVKNNKYSLQVTEPIKIEKGKSNLN